MPDDYRGQAVLCVRDYGAEHGELWLRGGPRGRRWVGGGWGPSAWEALRDLLDTHPREFAADLAAEGRSIDALVSLGDWRREPEDELAGFTCMVLRDERGVPVDHEPLRLVMPEDVVEVRELARWLAHRWREARGPDS